MLGDVCGRCTRMGWNAVGALVVMWRVVGGVVGSRGEEVEVDSGHSRMGNC